jgi:phosphate starvation-inducible PhoH-like protein
MGPQSKVIITGDTSQIDLPKKQKSGLIEAIRILENVKGIGFVALSGKDVVRHKIVKDIISAYDTHEKKQSND